jgi:competence protein ComEA
MDTTSPTPRPPPSDEPIPWPRSAQAALAILLAVALGLLAVNVCGYLPWGARPTQLIRGEILAYRIDLNHADRAELLQIPGIGPQLAERIETYRSEHGCFRSVEELKQVHGIGQATLERVRPWVSVDAGPNEDTAEVPSLPVSPKSSAPSAPIHVTKKVSLLSGPIDLNTASAEELGRLPGVGPKTAQAIVEARSTQPFRTVEDLRRLRGMGAKSLDRLRPYVTVSGDPTGMLRGADDISGQR